MNDEFVIFTIHFYFFTIISWYLIIYPYLCIRFYRSRKRGGVDTLPLLHCIT